MTIVLGINAYHGDAAACVLVDGKLVAAAEEERFRRLKHWAGFPSEAIRYCLREAGAGLSDVGHVAINQDSKANLGKKIGFVLKRGAAFRMIMDRLANRSERAGVAEELERVFEAKFSGTLHNVEHHVAHLASAFLVSPYEEAVAVSVDGFGDFASAAWGNGKGSRVTMREQVYFPHSLGIFYEAMTQYLGFPHYGDEYKLMGLASYGKPQYLDKLRRLVHLETDGRFRLALEFFRHDKEKIEYEWKEGEPKVGTLYSDALVDLLGPAGKPGNPITDYQKDLARSTQAMYEEAFFNLLRAAHAREPSDNLVLAGGCAMNSVANGRIRGNTPFKHVYVQSAAGDAGGAIGAAFHVWHELDRDAPREFVMDHAYWGPSFGEEQISALLARSRARLDEQGCTVRRVDDERALCDATAKAVSEGKVIGWFQGRMEWGPRALGNRSIIGDPRRADMKDILNLKIKRRESFRPFAPSVLREAVPEWFTVDDDVPFMMQVHPIREEKRPIIPAVTHVDGTGRLQTVQRATNPRYYRLIESFRDLTGVPMVLNTSFNENEPVVCRPEEALDCFLRTKMDVLVLGDWYISREQAATAA